MSKQAVADVIEWCVSRGVVLFADEVYQENVKYSDDAEPFTSFRAVATEKGFKAEDGDSPLQMVSFHSTSKGFVGECGLRGGYVTAPLLSLLLLRATTHPPLPPLLLLLLLLSPVTHSHLTSPLSGTLSSSGWRPGSALSCTSS